MENTKLVSGEIQHSSSKTRKCERLGLTNAKGPNQEIQISAGTNPISSKANQSKLCEGSRSVICHMLHVTCIYWIITLTEKMMGHNHFDDQFMSKLSITSTSWPNCWVEYKVEYKIVEWSIKWSIKWSIDFDIPLFLYLQLAPVSSDPCGRSGTICDDNIGGDYFYVDKSPSVYTKFTS